MANKWVRLDLEDGIAPVMEPKHISKATVNNRSMPRRCLMTGHNGDPSVWLPGEHIGRAFCIGVRREEPVSIHLIKELLFWTHQGPGAVNSCSCGR